MIEQPYVIMPVKDSIQMAEQAIRTIVSYGYPLTVYNDNSTLENTQYLHLLAAELQFQIIDLSVLTDHPSPNYLTVLQHAQQQALAQQTDIIIIESDVIIKADTIAQMQSIAANHQDAGLVAAITEDEQGNINFPYHYMNKIWYRLHHHTNNIEPTTKRLSFCCTLITYNFLKTYDFHLLDPSKNWYDVTISHKSLELGFKNYIKSTCRVVHYPHSSRPWKRLKYTNPLLYYWRKITQHKDKI